MVIYPGHTPEASALTRFFLDVFRFHNALMAAGERLTKPVGLTAARWQVLSTIARSSRPESVANIARLMGLTRQAVQRLANEMVASGHLRFEPNPNHKRAALLVLTCSGRKMFEEITSRQVMWANALAEGQSEEDIRKANAAILRLTQQLETRVGENSTP